jgi:hypothetical protein
MAPPPYWLVGAALEVLARAAELIDRRPPALVVDRSGQARRRAAAALEQQRRPEVAGVPGPIDPARWQPIELTITEPSFCPDFLHEQAWFVSARLREVLALDEAVAQYLPVDDRRSHPAARAQDYRLLHVHAVRDAIDPARAKLMTLDYPELDGRVSRQVVGVETIVWRADFVADVPLFRDPRDQRVFATDALAERVLRAGIADMAFQDVTSPLGRTTLVLKTL